MGDSAGSVTTAAHLVVLSQQAAEVCHVAELYDVKDGFDRRAADVERLELGCHLVHSIHSLRKHHLAQSVESTPHELFVSLCTLHVSEHPPSLC